MLSRWKAGAAPSTRLIRWLATDTTGGVRPPSTSPANATGTPSATTTATTTSADATTTATPSTATTTAASTDTSASSKPAAGAPARPPRQRTPYHTKSRPVPGKATAGANAAAVAAFLPPTPGEPVGRAWRAGELRLKSYADLHALWFVLLRERAVLDTTAEWCRGARRHPVRVASSLVKVKKSMARVKSVVGERVRAFKAKKEREAAAAAAAAGGGERGEALATMGGEKEVGPAGLATLMRTEDAPQGVLRGRRGRGGGRRA
ncbi:hypothetical protein I4F81_010011 [Pyropia yezoensis]|uniref:Uncharacterized protein n=1 Tax=Pyropia yezoensis TaxID=2788 RepID=A0ACC3CC30_PYRYE|nr:hypothetical protein I4F81_010011 [Neopyropia yezoensis]